MTRIVCISDTHSLHNRIVLPEGDILVSAGDITDVGKMPDIHSFAKWVAAYNFKHAITIAGNHDWCFVNRHKQEARKILEDHGITYLEDESVTFDGLNFYGSPWQPWFYDWAFNVERGKLLETIWAMIPDDTDVLITHGGPYGILDSVTSWCGTHVTEQAGCVDLLNRVKQLTHLKLHVFGHLHYDGGKQFIHEQVNGTQFVNAAICNDRYDPCREPIVVDI